jgi:transmembrane sensor
MSEPRPTISRDELETLAAHWLARRDAGLSEAAERELDAWLAADPRHACALREMEAAWTAFDQPRRSGVADGMIAELAVRQRRRRWRVTLGAVTTLAAAACVAGAFFFAPTNSRSPAAPAATLAAGILSKPETRVLPDGSVVELNQGAAIAVEFSAARRGIRLLRGEAHFAVVKDPARPFVVSAGAIAVRAVGTAFAVKLDPLAVDVLVTEGRVAIEHPVAAPVSADSEPVTAGKGERVSVPVTTTASAALQPQPVSSAEIDRLLAWRGPRLELSGTSVAEAVALLNRENTARIAIEDSEVGAMRMSGVFRADNAEGFVRLLESHYGVVVERRGPGEMILRKAR